jgi:uncharacterized protein (TIGR03086 family)
MPPTAATQTDDLVDLLDRAFAQSEQIICLVGPDRWSLPTPCDLFDVRTLVGHMVFAADRVAGAGRREALTLDGPPTKEIADTEWAAAFGKAAAAALDAWRRPAALQGEIVLPFGTFSATVVAAIYVLEQVTHAWDLATAVGAVDRLDQELARSVLPIAAEVILPEYRGPEPMPFAAEVTVSLTAPAADRLAGFMGRRVASTEGASASDRREREDLLDALRKHRSFLLQTVKGITDDQAGLRSTVSALCLGGIIKHVTRVEHRWTNFIEQGAAAMSFDESSYAEHAASFTMNQNDTLAGLLEEYQAVADRTDTLLTNLGSIELAHPLPEAPWFEAGAAWTARRVALHILAETAQHAGHADILRETIDGAKTMG